MAIKAFIPTGNQVVKEFIEAFGLKWKGLRSFTLNINTDDAVTIDCSYYAEEESIKNGTVVFKDQRFELHEILKEEEKDVPNMS